MGKFEEVIKMHVECEEAKGNKMIKKLLENEHFVYFCKFCQSKKETVSKSHNLGINSVEDVLSFLGHNPLKRGNLNYLSKLESVVNYHSFFC